MFYEEKMIGGKLMFRHSPDGEFKVSGADRAFDKIIELQDIIIDLKACLRTCANSAKGGLEQHGA